MLDKIECLCIENLLNLVKCMLARLGVCPRQEEGSDKGPEVLYLSRLIRPGWKGLAGKML
jgi:hypothetical protein